MKVSWVPMGCLGSLVRRPVSIDLESTYRQVGVRGFGRGIFDYEPQLGRDLGKLRFFEVEPKRLVVSNIKAWEGAVAATEEDESGRIASNRFLTYDLHGALLDYVTHWLLSSRGVRVLGQASPGSADRNRTLSIAKFEATKVPVPCSADQERIAAHLGHLSAQLANQTSEVDMRAFLPRLLGDLLRSCKLPTVPLSELCANNQLVIHPGDPLQGATSFVGLEHVESHTGRSAGGRPIDEEKGRKLLFRPGQVTYGYLRPYLNKAWVADSTGLCSVEQFVLDPKVGVDPHLLSIVLRSDIVWLAAKDATNSLQLPRLGLSTLLSLEVPDVRRVRADSGFMAECSSMTSRAIRASELSRHRRTLADSILPAARNEIFNAMR